MFRERKRLDLEPIRERECFLRSSQDYPLDTLRANYLNDISALLAEVENLREQLSIRERLASAGANRPRVERKVSELRADIERLAERFHVRTSG